MLSREGQPKLAENHTRSTPRSPRPTAALFALWLRVCEAGRFGGSPSGRRGEGWSRRHPRGTAWSWLKALSEHVGMSAENNNRTPDGRGRGGRGKGGGGRGSPPCVRPASPTLGTISNRFGDSSAALTFASVLEPARALLQKSPRFRRFSLRAILRRRSVNASASSHDGGASGKDGASVPSRTPPLPPAPVAPVAASALQKSKIARSSAE